MIPLIPQDKSNHYVYGQGIFALSTVVSYYTPPGGDLKLSVVVGLVVAAIFAVGKEVRDKVTKKGTPEPLDVLWTMAGAGLPALLLAIAF